MTRDTQETVSMRRLPGQTGIETLSARYLNQHFKPHAHDEYLFGVIAGGVHAVWCRGEMAHVPEGSVVTMRPGDVHHGGAGAAAGWHQRMIYVPEAAMRDIVRDLTDRPQGGTLDFGAAFHARPGLARRFGALHEVLHAGAGALARDMALDRLMRMLMAELAPAIAPPERPAPEGRIRDAVAYLDAHFEEDVTLEALCAVSGLRRRQTIDAFRRQTGLPPHAWLIQRRIMRAKEMLRAGVPPAEVAAATGFADQSHLTRHFRAIMGVTPGNWRRA